MRVPYIWYNAVMLPGQAFKFTSWQNLDSFVAKDFCAPHAVQ
jgi:hypothetical protein